MSACTSSRKWTPAALVRLGAGVLTMAGAAACGPEQTGPSLIIPPKSGAKEEGTVGPAKVKDVHPTGDPGDSGGGSVGPQKLSLIPSVAECEQDEMLPARVWRLSEEQIRNTLSDVFGTTYSAHMRPLSDSEHERFTNNAEMLRLGNVQLQSMLAMSEDVSNAATDPSNGLADLRACVAATGDACVTAAIDAYGEKLWRRPVSGGERDALKATFASMISGTAGRRIALRAVIERILLSPYFFYRSELGDAVAGSPGLRKLNHFEIASGLSFLIWNGPPDAALLASAKANKLHDQAELDAQTLRLLADPRAKRSMLGFFDDWLDLPKVQTALKDEPFNSVLTTNLRTAMRNETTTFINTLVWSDNAPLKELFSADYSYVNSALGAYYGVSASGASFAKVSFPAGQRAGLLTHGSYLNAHSGQRSTGFVHRGVFFVENVLCKAIPPPPPGINGVMNQPMGEAPKTEREIQALHSANPACASCHKFIDPFGSAFEKYDPIGRYRTTQNGVTIDASGAVTGLGEASLAFGDITQYMKQASATDYFAQCFTKKFYQYAFGIAPLTQNSCDVARLYEGFSGSQARVREMLPAALRMKSIVYRRAAE